MKTAISGTLAQHAADSRVSAEGYVSPLLERVLVMDRVVDLLLQTAKARIHWPEFYAKAVGVLASLALATDEYDLAFARLLNAKRYASRDEFGAATFELRQLRGMLS